MPVNAAAKVFKSPGVKILACFHAQNGIGPLWPKGYARGNERPGFQQGEALARLAAANAGQERAGAIHGPDCPALIHAAFKTVGCFRNQAQSAGSLADCGRRKDSRFQKNITAFGGDLGIRAAHDAGQADRAIGIANAQIRFCQFAILAVKGYQPFPSFGAAHDNLPVLEFVIIKRMQWLSDFVKNIIGNIDDIGNGPDANGLQAAAEFQRRGGDGHVGYDAARIQPAEIGIVNTEGNYDFGQLYKRQGGNILP